MAAGLPACGKQDVKREAGKAGNKVEQKANQAKRKAEQAKQKARRKAESSREASLTKPVFASRLTRHATPWAE